MNGSLFWAASISCRVTEEGKEETASIQLALSATTTLDSPRRYSNFGAYRRINFTSQDRHLRICFMPVCGCRKVSGL